MQPKDKADIAKDEVTKGFKEPVTEEKFIVQIIEDEDYEFKVPTSLNETLKEILDKDPNRFIGCGG